MDKSLKMVKDSKAIIDNIIFDVDFASNSVLRDSMYKHFYAWYLTWPDYGMELQSIQHKADMIRDYYNKLYESTTWREKYKVNPTENYDRYEDWSEDGLGTINSKSETASSVGSSSIDTQSGKNTNTVTTYQNPMGSGEDDKKIGSSVTETNPGEKLTNESNSDTKSENSTSQDSKSTNKHSGHIHGNIGVMTTWQMQKEYRDNLIKLENQYLDEFKPCFILALLGVDGN